MNFVKMPGERPCFTRCCFYSVSGCSAAFPWSCFRQQKNNGLAAAFSQASEKKLDKKILILSLVILAVLAFYIWGVQGLEVYGVCLVLQGVLFAWYDKWSKKEFRRYYRRPWLDFSCRQRN